MNSPILKGFFIADWRVSPAEGLISRDSELVHLEPKAMEVLVYLASRPGEVITREELERDVWHGALVGYDAVTSTVIKLRKALQDSARQPRFIATIPKKGYQLIAPISYPEGSEGYEPAVYVTNEPKADAQRGRQTRSVHRSGLVIVVLAGILVLGLVWLWPSVLSPPGPLTPPDGQNSIVLPSIVVLPFENLNDDPKQEYLVDGITEDIITDLSRLSKLLVIASNTSFTYKGRQVSPEEVGADLNVRYVLKGSIRQLGNVVRVNVQLVDAKTGFNAWAERYDRKIAEVFAVQDEVTQSIVNALAVKLTSQEKHRLAQRTTDNLKAYDFFQEGQRLSRVSTKETSQQSREAYRNAIELDPGYGRAHGALAYTLGFEYLRGWADAPLGNLDRALELAKKAVTLDDSIPQTYWALGYVYLRRKEYDNAEKAVSQAINIAPNYADGYGLLALISNNLGQPKRAIELITEGMRLNPYYTWDYPYNLGRAYYTLGNYDAAIAELERAQERNENVVPVKLFLAASYVKADRLEDAEWVTDQLQIMSPTATLTHTEKTLPIANTEDKNALLEDLRKAGLPE